MYDYSKKKERPRLVDTRTFAARCAPYHINRQKEVNIRR